jgi:glutamine synthetase
MTGNAYQQSGEPLPLVWSDAIERFAASEFANHYFGERFTHLYSTVKRAEMEEFNSHITPLEVARYLGPL